MKKKLLSTYKNIFSAILSILVLISLCLLLTFALVFPLWKFSTTNPNAYSIIVVSIFVLIFIYFIISRIRKSSVRNTMRVFLKIFIILLSITLLIVFVLQGKRLLAIPVILLTFVAYGITSHFLKNNDKN